MKRFLPILIFIVFSVLHASGQASRDPNQGPGGKILNLYPNPATTQITFDLQPDAPKGLSISIFNFLGKKMHEVTNLNARTTVSLNDFNRGMYIYRLTDASGKLVESGKFQVSK